MYQTNVQHNQHLTNNQLPVEHYTNAHARGTCKHSNTQSIQTYVWKTTHKQNIADHKLVTQKIKHGATNHTTHIVYPNTMLYMHNTCSFSTHSQSYKHLATSVPIQTYKHTSLTYRKTSMIVHQKVTLRQTKPYT